ncbi:hypothetical protein [Clostridium butyricum]
MLSFKEQMNEDLDVFFNLNEFGDTHIIDGMPKTVVIDNETLKERIRKEYDGILQADLLYFIKESEVFKKPKSGEMQNFDGCLYNVFDVKYDSGVYEIILQGAMN